MTNKPNASFVVGKVSDFENSRGYFIGQFMGQYGRTDLVSDQVEVAWKKLTPDFKEIPHHHKIGIDISIVVSGHITAKIDGKRYELRQKDFLVVYPPTIVEDFVIHEESEIITIKSPSVAADKYNL